MFDQILDFSESNGLVLCSDTDSAQNSYELLYLNEIKKLGTHAVFFRRYFKNSDPKTAYKSEPSVCIFLETEIQLNSVKHKNIHAALWSENKVDAYIIYGNSRVEIFNVKKPVPGSTDENPLSKLCLASGLISEIDKERFGAQLFGTGTFWEHQENQKNLSVENSPYRHLVDYLMEVRKRLRSKDFLHLGSSTIDKILVLSILVKFLEKKKDEDTQRSTLDEIYQSLDIDSLEEGVTRGLFLNVLDELAKEFNGKVFDQFSSEERESLSKTSLNVLAEFLTAKIDIATRQLFFWEQYDFQYLPAEVISAIYENFIQAEAELDGGGREKGVVYTPIHLVNFLIDEVMPLDNPPESFVKAGDYKILDPTCGSGVFLVAAYKRLLQWWAVAESKKTGNITYPDVAAAQKLLEDNIYGVDIKETAVRVSIFSLTTALLDFLNPKQVWGNLKFKDLSQRNITQAPPVTGFFSWALDRKKEGVKFSLAIGNPPFNSEKGVKKADVLDPQLISELDLKHKNIPRQNFALHFFEASIALSDCICMIIPSNVLLYDKSAKEYRKELFTDYTVSDIYDFTHLRETLFVKKGGGEKRGRTPVVALIAQNKQSQYQQIKHTVVKRTASVEQKQKFEIDDYDRHVIKWDWVVDADKQFVWKTNLLGGGRLFHLINRVSHFESLKGFLDRKRLENNWEYSIGYISKHSQKRAFEADFISGRETIKPKTFNEKGDFETIISTDQKFVEPRNKALFSPPHIIFKLVVEQNSIPMTLVDRYLTFNSSFVGISSPQSDKSDLLEIYERFQNNKEVSNLLRAYILSTSSKAAVYHDTSIVKEDIDLLPYPKTTESLYLSSSEKILIEDVLKYKRYQGNAIATKFSYGQKLHQSVCIADLSEYGKIICQELNDIYSEENNSWQVGKVYRNESYTIFQIGFGATGGLKHEFIQGEPDEKVQQLINNEIANRGAAYKRIIRLYDHIDGFDCVFFIKPNAFRYWMKSIALRDADETFSDLKNEGF